MSEDEFQKIVEDLAKKHGWLCYHVPYGVPRPAGFPDLILVRDRVLFRELKIKDRAPKRKQKEWLRKLKEAGCDAGIWRPSDLKKIEEELECPKEKARRLEEKEKEIKQKEKELDELRRNIEAEIEARVEEEWERIEQIKQDMGIGHYH